MAIELAPLGTVRFQIQPSITLEATPRGTFHIFELTDITIEGDRLQAKQKGVAAADWLSVDSDQVGTLDVRYCAETVDGALVYVSYAGEVDLSAGLTAASVYATPLFQTGDQGMPGSTRSRPSPRARWTNRWSSLMRFTSSSSRWHDRPGTGSRAVQARHSSRAMGLFRTAVARRWRVDVGAAAALVRGLAASTHSRVPPPATARTRCPG